MKRKIIEIDQQKCNGCSQCASSCPEGAIQMVEGKAQVVGEFLCDGLGACIGQCPVGAIKIVEKESEPYDEIKVMQNMVQKGEKVIIAHLKHLFDHGQTTWYNQAKEYVKKNGINIDFENEVEKKKNEFCCSHAAEMTISREKDEKDKENLDNLEFPSMLSNWPVQLHLVNPNAPYFKNADLLIAADCTAFSFGNFHNEFLKGKKLIIACPKLDSGKDIYIDKLTSIFSNMDINSITVLIMQVPCCMGLVSLVQTAISKSLKIIDFKVIILSIDGKILSEKTITMKKI